MLDGSPLPPATQLAALLGARPVASAVLAARNHDRQKVRFVGTAKREKNGSTVSSLPPFFTSGCISVCLSMSQDGAEVIELVFHLVQLAQHPKKFWLQLPKLGIHPFPAPSLRLQLGGRGSFP